MKPTPQLSTRQRQTFFLLLPPISPRIWYDTLGEKMKKLGFRISPYDAGLWISTTKSKLYVTAHIDDFKIVCQHREDGEWLIEALSQEFELKNLGNMGRYLGMDVTISEDGIKLTFPTIIYERGLGKVWNAKLPSGKHSNCRRNRH
jgi:Reverse transcriptase (RNA-dependent DNA polymerase)